MPSPDHFALIQVPQVHLDPAPPLLAAMRPLAIEDVANLPDELRRAGGGGEGGSGIPDPLSLGELDVTNLFATNSSLGTADALSLDISGGLTADNAAFNSTDAGTLLADSCDISGGLTADNATFNSTSAGTLTADSCEVSGGLSCDNITIGGVLYQPTTLSICIGGTPTFITFLVQA